MVMETANTGGALLLDMLERTGALYVNVQRLGLHTADRPTARDGPLNRGCIERLVADVHDALSACIPVTTVGVGSVCSKLKPTIVTESSLVCGKFSAGAPLKSWIWYEATGASKLNADAPGPVERTLATITVSLAALSVEPTEARTCVLVVQAVDQHITCVRSIVAVMSNSAKPTPKRVTDSPAHLTKLPEGELDDTGASKLKAAPTAVATADATVSITGSSCTRRDAGDAQRMHVAESQDVVIQAAAVCGVPTATVGVSSQTPKLSPVTLNGVERLIAKFQDEMLDATGASNVNASMAVPISWVCRHAPAGPNLGSAQYCAMSQFTMSAIVRTTTRFIDVGRLVPSLYLLMQLIVLSLDQDSVAQAAL
jgi:hypothetical protein